MLHDLFKAIECLVHIDETKHVNLLLKENIQNSLNICELDFEEIIMKDHLKKYEISVTVSDSLQWKYICTTCYLLSKLVDEFKKAEENLLSINQKKNIKSLLQFTISYGILPSLLPGVGVPLKECNPSKSNYFIEQLNVMQKYDRLKSLCYFFCDIYSENNFQDVIISHFFTDFLAALFQMSYAPIAKTNFSMTVDNYTFVMTEELSSTLHYEQNKFRNILDNIVVNTYRPFIIKELIILQGPTNPPAPNFMKRSLSKHLSNCLISPGGLHALIKCLLDTPNIDTGTQWKHIDMITKLVSVTHGSLSTDEYLMNICEQLNELIEKYKHHIVLVAASCIATLYEKYDTNFSIQKLINSIVCPLSDSNKENNSKIILTQEKICRTINVLNLCFGNSKLCLPSKLLSPIIYTIFILKTFFKNNEDISSKLNNLVSKYFSSNSCKINHFYSALIYGETNEDINATSKLLFVCESVEIVAKYNHKREKMLSVEQSLDCMIDIIKSSEDSSELACSLFLFLLESLNESYTSKSKSYKFGDKSNDYLAIISTLENLAEMKCVLNHLKKDPSPVIIFITNIVTDYVSSGKKESEDYLMIGLLLLSTILPEIKEDCNLSPQLKELKKNLETITDKSSNEHLLIISKEIINIMSTSNKQKSKFDEAISQVCDPLLPVRAHGLIELNKLIEEEDTETISKKYLLQCVFQQNLRDTDSYIYLTAINGLALLAIHSTEDILSILSKEYISESKIGESTLTSDVEDESIKLRMKIGEILLKVTKKLGDKAINHKNILLNTFLSGCHDPDDLIRASSLSNLAELCRVLSYKLGTIVFEILSCIDKIIQNDKSQECRRASVLVISSLIKGLGKDSLFFLRDALLPIYRTLKTLYADEKEDPAVKLHAQIALEELNDIMRELLKPYLKR